MAPIRGRDPQAPHIFPELHLYPAGPSTSVERRRRASPRAVGRRTATGRDRGRRRGCAATATRIGVGFLVQAPSWWPSRDRGRARDPRGSRPPPRGLASRGSSTRGDDEGGGDRGPAHVELGSAAHAGGRLGARRPASLARKAGALPGSARLGTAKAWRPSRGPRRAWQRGGAGDRTFRFDRATLPRCSAVGNARAGAALEVGLLSRRPWRPG